MSNTSSQHLAVDGQSDRPVYRSGRSVSDAVAEHGLERAVKLSSNELPYGPLPSVQRVLVDFVTGGDGLNRYPDFRAAALKRAIADHHGIEIEQVTIGAGSSAIVEQLAIAFAAPGASVVTAAPSFELYRIAASLVDATATETKLRPDTVDVDDLLAAVTPRTRLVFVANPNNPTSTGITGGEIRRLAEHLPARCVLVVDEAYVDFADDPSATSADCLIDQHRNVAVLRTFSKAHGLASLRVGYLLAHPEIVIEVDRFAPPFQVNALGQIAAVASLGAGAELADRVRRIIDERRRVEVALARSGYVVPSSQANFVWMPTGGHSNELATEIERRGVITRPIGSYGLRITIGTPVENDTFLEALDAVVASRPDRTSAWSTVVPGTS